MQKNHENYGFYSSEVEAMEIVNLLNEADWDMTKLSPEDWNKLTINQHLKTVINIYTFEYRFYRQVS